MGKARRPQPLIIRITHWLNVPALALMAMSGLQIFLAYPWFGPRGATYDWLPLQGIDVPEWMRVGGWLAGARNWHFAIAWLLVVNSLGWLVYLAVSGEWRRRFFWPPRDLRPALEQVKYYLKLRAEPPPIVPANGLYNGLQRAAYTSALGLGVLEVLSGLVMYKPVQLHRLTWLLGGYDVARVIHFFAMVGLGGFVVAHVVMVALHPKSLGEMITGGKPDA